jgi:heparanase
MSARHNLAFWLGLGLVGLGGTGCRQSGKPEVPSAAEHLAPATMPRIGTIDDRFQSYNIEMLEVTGGKFWKPYDGKADSAHQQKQPAADAGAGGATPAGMDPNAYAYRPPIDLANARRRKLAAALGPAYVRVSGTWANTTYLADSDPAPKTPPKDFDGVLSRPQWKGVVEFARAVDAKLVTSFATSPGTRDAEGVWTPTEAGKFLAYTKAVGGTIAAAEFMNEPTFAAMGGAPKGYDAAAYGRDFKAFRAFARRTAPEMVILGPGSVGETDGKWGLAYGSTPMLKTEDLLKASGPGIDAFSYHHYGASSQRCAGKGMPGTTADAALSEEWLARTDQTLSFYRKLRDQYEPGKPMWVTEVADAACGGNPWASTFLDTFRYLDQLGRLSKQGVQVVMHNTLDASDYGLLDEDTLAPRPNYWGALLWRRLMGTTVLDSGVPIQKGLHVYAHSLRGTPGGVALLVINNDREAARTLKIPTEARRYTLSASSLQKTRVQLNGIELKLGANDELPELAGVPVAAGELSFDPATITFLAIPGAGNKDCK